jgi:RsmE family RNA methyltransferase
MNLVLLENHEFLTESSAQVGGRKAEHIQTVLKVKEGQSIRVGQIGGLVGRAVVASVGEKIRLADLALTEPPPAKLPVRFVVALPRPKAFRRIVEQIAMLGVSEIIFTNATKVDKSYWNSKLEDEGTIREKMLIGLEQAGDTVFPVVKFERLLKPFVEDRLSDWCGNAGKWIAHPASANKADFATDKSSSVIAIGPEGGWIDYEIKKFNDLGFRTFDLGPRILKVESAIQICSGKWMI